MNEKTEAAPSKGLEEAPAAFRSPEPIEESERPTRRPEELRDQDLRGQDLTTIEGLLPEHLAGADLTGAKLPEKIEKFPALDQVAAISSEARKIFIGLLAACVYSWLVIGTTEDVQLIVNTATSPLPIVNAPIPISGFYVVGATLLAAVYCYFHFYLQRLWRTLATLPAVFPDGVAQDDKTDPWLLTNLVLLQRKPPPPLAHLENLLTILLGWWLVPITLIALWARYLPAHNIVGLVWLAFLIAATTFFGRHTFGLAHVTLRRKAQPAHDRLRRPLGRVILSFLIPLIVIIVIISLSLSTLWPPRNGTGRVVTFSPSAPWESLREVDKSPAKLLNFVWIRTYADLREVEVAQRPEVWDGKDWGGIKRIELRDRNLAFADARSAFLANADLRGATLTGAHLGFADLQGAVFYDEVRDRPAQLQGATLWHAQLQGAVLTKAQLQGARLREAQLQSADLREAQLQGATLWHAQLQGARLQGANLQNANLSSAELWNATLSRANLQGADLRGAQVQGADLTEARLQGADLTGARLQGADLTGARLQGADLRETTIWRAQVNGALWDLADLRGSTVQPMTDSEIDSLIGEATKGIPDEELRNATTEQLYGALRAEKRLERPEFPEKWQSEPNVMFDKRDPKPEPLNWGSPMWVTESAYDQDLAKFLGDLACGSGVPEAQTRALAGRAIREKSDRSWPRLFAERLVINFPDCPPSGGLPEDMRRGLEELATRGDAAVAPPENSPPALVE